MTAMASIKESLIGGVIGSLATVLVGLMFSSATFNIFTGFLGQSVLPSDAVILVNGAECPSPWKRLENAGGRYLVTTGKTDDGPDFRLGSPGGRPKVTLLKENLPSFDVSIDYLYSDNDYAGKPTFFRFLRQFGNDTVPNTTKATYNAHFNGSAQAVAIEPQWYALTPCRR